MAEPIRILFIGDLVGKPGRNAVQRLLPVLSNRLSPDMVIANGENSAGGFGITAEISETLFDMGVDVITTGNHIWDQRDIYDYLDETPRLIRPLNYPGDSPGNGSYIYESPAGLKVGVLNLAGRVFMSNLDCPFVAADEEVARLRAETNIVLLDMHAETTSEKYAMAYYLDGRVSAILGTHTHVQTADERIFPKGTAYISDVGMTGPTNSVIGMKPDSVLTRFLTQRPTRFEVAKGGVELQAVFMTIDPDSGKALSIERIKEPLN